MALLDCLKCCRVINMDTNEVLYEATDDETEKFEKFVEIIEPLCDDMGADIYTYREAAITKSQLANDQLLDDDGAWIPYREIVINAAFVMSKGLTFDEACDEEIHADSYNYKIEFPDLGVDTVAEDLKIQF